MHYGLIQKKYPPSLRLSVTFAFFRFVLLFAGEYVYVANFARSDKISLGLQEESFSLTRVFYPGEKVSYLLPFCL